MRDYDRWLAVIRLLDQSVYLAQPRKGRRYKIRRSPVKDRFNTYAESPARITDRLSPSGIAVYWCDATACHYSDQLWKVGTARCAGHCVLSGATIKAGDLVYRPFKRRESPVNETAMMLAAEVDCRYPV